MTNQPRERGIIFSAPMVRALLAGTKTQTRRAVAMPRKRDSFIVVDHGTGWWPYQSDDGESELCDDGMEHPYSCPYGRPGDRLWVREAWRIGAWNEDLGAFAIDYCDGPRRDWLTDPNDHDGGGFEKLWVQCSDELAAKKVQPGSDGRYTWETGESPLRWRPSIHMPRWASRITLEITGVRVERLQDISEANALAEGVERLHHGFYPYGIRTFMTTFVGGEEVPVQCCVSARDSYHMLWDYINGRGAWNANPWVWVVEFRRIERGPAA